MLLLFLLALMGETQEGINPPPTGPPPDPAALVETVEKLASQAVPDARVQAGFFLSFRGPLKEAGKAFEQLAGLKEKALPGLQKLLHHERAQVRQNAAHFLGLIGGPQTVAPLAQALQDPSPGVRDQAVWALGRSASPTAVPLLDRARGEDPDLRVRRRAAVQYRFLQKFLIAEKAETAAERIAQLVPLVGYGPARARLREIGSSAVPSLIAALDFPDPSVAVGAATLLATIGDERGLAPLMEKYRASLEREEPRVSFAEALALYQHPSAWTYWQELLQLPDPAGQYWGLRAIAGSHRAEGQEIILKFLEKQVKQGEHRQGVSLGRTKVNPTAEACRILGEIGDDRALALLRRIVDDIPEDRNIVRPLAERSCRQIEQRLGKE